MPIITDTDTQILFPKQSLLSETEIATSIFGNNT